MGDASIEREELLTKIPGLSGDELLNALGRALGALETFVGGPLYPIRFYAEAVDERLIRGAWPGEVELTTLHACGVRCVLCLCEEREQDEAVIAHGMHTERIPIRDNTVPTEEQVAEALRIIAEQPRTFMHCEAGVGRTGYMVARYLITKGWKPWQALEDVERRGELVPCQREAILKLGGQYP